MASGEPVHVGPAFACGASQNGWTSANAPDFKVRSKDYLRSKVKEPSEPSAFRLVGVHGFTAANKIPFVTKDPCLTTRARAGIKGSRPFLFVFHFDIHPQHLVLIFELDPAAITGANANSSFAKTWSRFLAGDAAYKAPRIKLITSMVEAPWVVRKAVGKPVPALIGNKLTCTFDQSDDMLECTCDVNSSLPARIILGVVQGASGSCVCDLMLLIEGCKPDELPERILGGARVSRMDLRTFPPINDDAKSCISNPPTAPTEEEVETLIKAMSVDEEADEEAAHAERVRSPMVPPPDNNAHLTWSRPKSS